jgi:hypothetical protein
MKFYHTITLFIFTFLGLNFNLSAQYGLPINGMVHMKGVKKPLKGMVKINRKSDNVIFYDENKTQKQFSITEIDSMKTDDNQLYIVKNFEGSLTLFEVNLAGYISLLHQKKSDNYFFLRNDTVQLLNKEKLRGFLNSYFPEFSYTKKILDPEFKSVNYDDSFLIPFIQTYNQEKHATKRISLYNTYSRLKVGIGPYLAISHSISHIDFVRKSFSYTSSSQPNYGITLTLTGNNKFSFGLDLYRSKFEESLILKEVSNEVLGGTISYFYFNSLMSDIRFQYNFKKYSNQKINPFISVGPTFGFPFERNLQTALTRYDYVDDVYYTIPEYNLTQDLIPMFSFVGVNVGGGMDYSISKKYALRLQAKYQAVKATVGTINPRKAYGDADFDNKSISLGISLVRNL